LSGKFKDVSQLGYLLMATARNSSPARL